VQLLQAAIYGGQPLRDDLFTVQKEQGVY